MFCKHCGGQMNDNQAVCLSCGTKTGQGTAHCANCGNAVAPSAEVCMSCGVAIKKAGDLGGKDKVTMAIVCFFLGAIGIHNFMMGESKKGITRIVATLCCGLGGILALIDFIKILMDKYEVEPDKLI